MIIDATDYQHEPTPWAARAACAGTDPELWFPERGANIDRARAVCAACPVRAECLDYAVRWRIKHGIWGGLTPKALRRHWPAAPVPRRFPPLHGTTSRYHGGCRCGRCIEAQTACVEADR